MPSSDNSKVAIALLKEVEAQIELVLGSQIAQRFDPNDIQESTRIAVFCEDMIKQCEMAERKASDDQEVKLLSNILKAQLYGNWRKPMGERGTQKKAI